MLEMSDVIGLNLNPEANYPECEIDEKVVQRQQCDHLDLTEARCETEALFPVINVSLEVAAKKPTLIFYLNIRVIILEYSGDIKYWLNA